MLTMELPKSQKRTPRRLRLAYLTTEYPKVSHTFIRREILELERRGHDVVRLSIRMPSAPLVDPSDREEQKLTYAVLGESRVRLILGAISAGITRPASFARALQAARAMSLHSDRGHLRHLAYLVEAIRLGEILKHKGVRHVHVHFGTNAASVARLMKILFGISYSLTIHGPGEFDASIGHSLREKVADSTFTLAISHYCKAQLMRWVAPDDWEKIHVIHCTVNPEFLQDTTPVSPTADTLVCVGRLTPQKGQLFLVLFLILAQIGSQASAGSLKPLTVIELARKWVLPYLMGRLLISEIGDLRAAYRTMMVIVVILTILAIFECAVQLNPINMLLGKRYDLLEQGEGYRWGLKRAHVTFDHPIFFGMTLVLLLPWTLETRRQSILGQGSRWWRMMPWLIACGLFATVSRGPQLAAMATVGIYAFFRLSERRLTFLMIFLGAACVAYTQKETLIDALSCFAGEKNVEEIRFITIDGEEVEYSGTNHRLLLFRVYSQAIDQAGLFGFGYELKGVLIDENLAQRFASIDCHYLLFFLQHGYLGCGAFLILTLTILIKLIRRAWNPTDAIGSFAGGLAGALASVAVLLVSVWFSPDFAGVWLFTAGLATRLLEVNLTDTPPSSEATDNVSSTAIAHHQSRERRGRFSAHNHSGRRRPNPPTRPLGDRQRW